MKKRHFVAIKQNLHMTFLSIFQTHPDDASPIVNALQRIHFFIELINSFITNSNL